MNWQKICAATWRANRWKRGLSAALSGSPAGAAGTPWRVRWSPPWRSRAGRHDCLDLFRPSGHRRKQAEIDAAVAKVNADNAQAANDTASATSISPRCWSQSAWDEVRIQDLTDALAAVKPEHTLGTDYRRFEWYYWQRACHMDLLTVPVAGPAYCVRFSPKGDRLAIAGEAGKLWIADATTGRTINEISAHDGPIWSLSFTSDGGAWPAPATTGRSACGTLRPAS